MKKLAIVVGHNSKSRGATRKDNGVTEYEYNSGLADIIVQNARDFGIDVHVFYRKPGSGYSTEIKNVYHEVDSWGADYSIELHFNSAGDSRASGTETLSSGSQGSIKLAEAVQMEMVDTLGLRNRGIKIRNSRTKGRGYKSLISGKCPAIIIEPFFGSSSEDNKRTDELYEKESLAEAILDGVSSI